MNTLRLSTFSLTLAIAVFVLGHANPSLAGPSCLKKPDHPNCIAPDDGGGKILKAKFDLTIEMGDNENINDDGSGLYRDSSKDHVQISGSGSGFRFDTNGQNTSKPSRYERARLVLMSFTGDSTFEEFEIDFRFNQTEGLDLGLLEAGGESGTVAASLQYYGGDPVVGFNADNYGILGFGALNAPNPNETCLTDAGKIKVTRNTDDWTLESLSGEACRFAKDANGNICTTERFDSESCDVKPELIDFKFKFTIVQQ